MWLEAFQTDLMVVPISDAADSDIQMGLQSTSTRKAISDGDGPVCDNFRGCRIRRVLWPCLASYFSSLFFKFIHFLYFHGSLVTI